MFAAFIYTECISPGPFKSESGFKFKSVQELALAESSPSSSSLEQRMNIASSAFLPYKAPAIDSFMTPDEFLALEKQWSLQEVGPGNFMFSRLFTSGVSNGRPDNPFHQGFIYDFSDVESMVSSTRELTGLNFARPADFASWAEWHNPRGDAELEAAELEEHNPPMPSIDSADWNRAAERIFETDIDEALQITSGFEEAMREGSNLGINTGGVQELLDWVSFLTHLVPLNSGWSLQFSSNDAGKHFAKVPPRTSIFRADSHIARKSVTDWANLVRVVVESGIYSDVETMIGELSSALIFNPNNGLQGLSALPLACCFIDQDLMDPDDLAAMAVLVSSLLNELVPPSHWQSERLAQGTFLKLEQGNAAIRALSNADLVYEALSRLPVLG